MTLRPTLDALLTDPAARAVGAPRTAGSDDVTRGFVTSVHHAPVPEGAPDVPFVLLRPVRAPGVVPWLLHLHDGGLVGGTPYDDLSAVLDLATRTGCAVASVDYRLAPRDPYPAAVEDAYAALVWLVDNAADLGLDPDRGVVTGVGAGGGLAAATALLARDLDWPRLAGQLLVRPMLDDRGTGPADACGAGTGTGDHVVPADGWLAYLGARAGGGDVPPYAAPGRAAALGGLPPAFVEVGAAEPARAEAVDYATRLWLCGGAAELHVWPHGPHLFGALAHGAGTLLEAREARTQWLRRVLAAGAELDWRTSA